MERALGVLGTHLGPLLATLIIPFLIMLIFAEIRRGFGNAVTAMPDVLVFLFSADFFFAVSPEPWRSIVNPALKDAFPVVSATLSLAAMVGFLLVMRVERQIASHHLGARWPVPNRDLMPAELRGVRYPHARLFLSWVGIAFLVGLNAAAFVLR